MVAIKPTNETLFDTNLADNKNTHVYIARKQRANDIIINWDVKYEISWNKYQIKETDMRQKTASFTTPNYFDLTTGQYCVLITSTMHEDFGGVLMSVEYDSKTGLYTYQCQDHSRNHQSKFDLVVKNRKLHRVLKYLLTHGNYPIKGKVKKSIKKAYKKSLSGLKPAYQYDQKPYGSTLGFNPMTTPVTAIIRNKSWIEAIRDLVFGTGAYIDIYIDKYGIVHIEPYHKDDLFNSGLYITTPEIASLNPKFDTTNILTGVVVQSTNSKKSGKTYSGKTLVNLDLSAVFGDFTGMIANPNQSTTQSSSGKSSSKKKSNSSTKTSNPYNTKKKVVYLNCDLINGYSTDNQRMKDLAKILKKNGWEVHNVGVGSEAHWKRRGEVKKGIWFCLYGGVCAGTLKEHCTSSWFLNPLKKHKSRVVVGIFPPASSIKKGGRYYKHLGPAHDWRGNRAYANIDYPGKFLSKHGIPWMYAKNAKEMAAKFLAGGDNYTTSGKTYKYYDSWQKHDVKWIK